MTTSGLLTAAGRAVLGWFFVHSGQRVLRNPGPAASLSATTLARIRERVPLLPPDDVMVVRGNAALHVVAGSLLIVGVTPRLAALALAGSLVPTTMAGHPYWTVADPAARAQQKIHFDKNTAVLGGLLALAAGGR